jgi:hypothetical protein
MTKHAIEIELTGPTKTVIEEDAPDARMSLLELGDAPSARERQAIPKLREEPAEAPAATGVCRCPLGTRAPKPRGSEAGWRCPGCALPRQAPAGARTARTASEGSQASLESAPAGFEAIAAEAARNATADRRLAPVRASAQAEAPTETARLLRGEQAVAGLAVAGMGELFAWRGRGDITNQRMRALGEEHGIPRDWMLAPESAKAQAARSVKLLAAKGIVISVINKSEELERNASAEEEMNFISRWTVGRVDHRAKPGEALGNATLVATLERDGTLTLEGNDESVRKVREEFDRRMADEVHRSTDITGWLATTLRFRLGAVEYGALGWYVPHQSVAMARRLADMLATAGWGEGWVGTSARTCPLGTTDALCDGLALGLAAEVDAELAMLEMRREQLRSGSSDKATKDVGSRAAMTYLAKLRVLLERIVNYGALLGEERVAVLRERVRLASVEVSKQAEGSDFIERFDLIFEELREEKAREAAREQLA